MFEWLFGRSNTDFNWQQEQQMRTLSKFERRRADAGLPHADIPDKGWFVGPDGQEHTVRNLNKDVWNPFGNEGRS